MDDTASDLDPDPPALARVLEPGSAPVPVRVYVPEAQRPRYIMVSDFQRFELTDLETRREWRFPLADLKKRVAAFPEVIFTSSETGEGIAELRAAVALLLAQRGA